MCESPETAKKCDKGKDPKTCTPEQIKECHGDTAKHACEVPAGKGCK